MEQYLFAFGKLLDVDITTTLLNREIEEIPAILNDYVLKEDGHYYFITEESGEKVDGVIISLTADELLICDRWEEVPFYERIIVSANLKEEFLKSI